MAEQPTNQFIAGGRECLEATPEYRQKRDAIKARLLASYHDQLTQATFWQRLRIHWIIQREFQNACADLVSDEALFFRS